MLSVPPVSSASQHEIIPLICDIYKYKIFVDFLPLSHPFTKLFRFYSLFFSHKSVTATPRSFLLLLSELPPIYLYHCGNIMPRTAKQYSRCSPLRLFERGPVFHMQLQIPMGVFLQSHHVANSWHLYIFHLPMTSLFHGLPILLIPSIAQENSWLTSQFLQNQWKFHLIE